MKAFFKSLFVLIALGICAFPALLVVLLASLRMLFFKKKRPAASGRTILLTGGKMTKCLQLARMFQALGDRVIVAETPLYRWCGTRFSDSIEKFIKIPAITGEGETYQQALIDLAKVEKVDVFVPVASPKAALYDAKAKPFFPSTTKVFHLDEDLVRQLDDKHQFSELCRSFGLSAPESYLVESQEALLSLQLTAGKKYILKKIAYDPVYRLDLRQLPYSGWEKWLASLPISTEEPWVLQEFIEGREVCTHTTTQAGQINLYVCSDSSPFQVNYKMLYLDQVEAWVKSFITQLGGTGQISFDFIIRDDGTVVPIECNPRTHSAITLFHNQLTAGRAYHPSTDTKTYLPNESSGQTYWIYHELYRLLTNKSPQQFFSLLKRIWTGKEAVFSWEDPWPFWFNNHVSIPYQLLQRMKQGATWTRIDFNIGKLVVPGGD
ncbi:MAG: ATP-grasp enzyme [Bacteroidota bacterium]